MTAYELQLALGNEVERISKDILLKDVKGYPAHIKAFAQSLPKRFQDVADMEDDEGDIMPEAGEDEDPYPYCVVRIDSGRLETAESTHEITTTLVFGIFDDDARCLGHQAIMNLIHKITERFIKNPVLNNKCRMNEAADINWVLDDEDKYPYYFGAMEMTWDTFFAGREDDKYA